MKYPTMDEVDRADRFQLARWYRFLPSPGSESVDRATFQSDMESERAIADRICARFDELGGMTPEISKAIGWDR